jgi:hypothetical protein
MCVCEKGHGYSFRPSRSLQVAIRLPHRQVRVYRAGSLGVQSNLLPLTQGYLLGACR